MKDMIRELGKRLCSPWNEYAVVNIAFICNDRGDEQRTIAIVTYANGQKVVIKAYQNCYTTVERVEAWAELSGVYKSAGVSTPGFIQFEDGQYAQHVQVGSDPYIVWAEYYLAGESMERDDWSQGFTTEQMRQIGKVLGKMHDASATSKMQVIGNSPYVLFDTFSEVDTCDENQWHANRLMSELTQVPVLQDKVEELRKKYEHLRREIEAVYPTLPSGMVQGDMSPNNLLADEEGNVTGIIDYNVAGCDCFINHMVQEGIFLSFGCQENALVDQVEQKRRVQLFETFVQAYSLSYKLTRAERAQAYKIYSIVRPFRMEIVAEVLKAVRTEEYRFARAYLDWAIENMQSTRQVFW